MKVKFSKDHLEHKKGDVKEFNDWRGNYFVRTGVAKKVEKKERKSSKKKENKNGKPKSETK